MIDKKRVFTFLGLAYGLAWLLSLIAYLTGASNSPYIAVLLMLIMVTPAAAHLLTRLLTREGWQRLYLRPHIKQGWRYWLLAWFGISALIVVNAVIFFALFPSNLDLQLTPVQAMLPEGSGMSPGLFVVLGVIQGTLLSPFVNGLLTFGEEFGWRAYLQPKLMPLGKRKAMLLMGGIWGLWHAPIIMMGHNYGLDYPGAPYLGVVVMVWFTTVVGTLLGWLTDRAGSVWPAVIGHAVINGMVALPSYALMGQPHPLLGPMSVGLLGGTGFTVVALILLINKRSFVASEPSVAHAAHMNVQHAR